VSASCWIDPLARPATWLLAYLVLMVGRQRFEQWLVARFQRRQWRGTTPITWSIPRTRGGSPGNAIVHILATIAALLAGATIPLASEIRTGSWALPFHLFGNADAGLLFVLALGWISIGLLALAGRSTDRRLGRAAVRDIVGKLLLAVVPIILIALSLVMTAGSLHARQEGSLSLTTLIELQAGWGGLRWLGIFQPLALLLWLPCAALVRPEVRTRATLACQTEVLNRALLTSALFLGGWQGPFAEQFVWLGLVYTAMKVSIVTFLWVWARSSLPMIDLTTHARAMWQVFAPLAAINLLLTAVIVAVL